MDKQVSVAAILDIVRRRKNFLLIPFVVITVLSIVGAFVLPKRFESYTTILLEKDQTKDPIMDYWTRAGMTWGGDNQLSTFNEILTSRTTIKALLDSLGREPELNTNEKWDELIDVTRRQITTMLTGNDAFRITFADKDPMATKRATEVLSNIYIQTSLRSDRQQAEETVKFLEQKVEELRREFEAQQRDYLGTRQRSLSSQPQDEESLRPQLAKISEDLSVVERRLELQRRAKNQIENIRQNLDNPDVVSQIAALDPQGAGILVDSLRSVASRYAQLRTRYTTVYPQVVSARKQLGELLQQSGQALEVDISNSRAKLASLQSDRDQMVRGISTSINTGTVTAERGSEYQRVKDNYEAAKQRLDQAKVKKELADRGASRYVILDPAFVPSTPSKPKVGLIIGGGSALGLIVGIAAMFMMEYYDPTIRRRQDVEVFNRPIIGYIP